jgi:hypothetical protein
VQRCPSTGERIDISTTALPTSQPWPPCSAFTRRSPQPLAPPARPALRRLPIRCDSLVEGHPLLPGLVVGTSARPTAFDGTEEWCLSAPRSTSSPSKGSTDLRSASLNKQFANAELQPTGFLTASFRGHLKPPSLQLWAATCCAFARAMVSCRTAFKLRLLDARDFEYLGVHICPVPGLIDGDDGNGAVAGDPGTLDRGTQRPGPSWRSWFH